MKAFWSILGLLVIALAVMLVLRGRWAASITPIPPAPAIDPFPYAAVPHPPVIPTPPHVGPDILAPSPEAPSDEPAPPPTQPPQVRATPGGFEVVPSTPTPSTPLAPSSPTPDSPPAPTPPTPDDSALSETTDPILQAINEQITGKPATPALPPTPPTPAPASSSPTPDSRLPTPASASSAPLPPAKIIKQDDGSTLVDDRYVMKGAGTKADPYRITWEHLVSAELVYQPRLGRKQLPERIKMLDGKWVRLSGYIAFPIMANTQDEMLMMLNQWDGCCIGVPPTPYDAVEVNLNAAAKGDTRLRATGTVQGILRVDPYLVKDWLVSLYLMDNADLVESGGMQPAESPVHGK